jgi:hypothetical protein
MRAHTSGRVTSFVTMREMQCAGVRSYILQGTMWAMQCVPPSRKTYPCQNDYLLPRIQAVQAACNNIQWTAGKQALEPTVLCYKISNELSVVITFYSCYSTCDVNGEMLDDDDNDDGNTVFYLCTIKILPSNYVHYLQPLESIWVLAPPGLMHLGLKTCPLCPTFCTKL